MEPWREEEADLPNKTACKLLEAANEFDLAAILDALQPLTACVGGDRPN